MKGFRKELILSILASHAFEEKADEGGEEQKKSVKRAKKEKKGDSKRRKGE